ncbi:MAG: glycosyltransferase N-terminal domain-containing protein [Planctomycetota bacterium]
MNPLDAAYLLGGALSAPAWARKARGDWPDRLGFAVSAAQTRHASDRPRVLLHAVSVGEVNALRTLVPLLAPRARVIVTSTTDTGLARARSLFEATAEVVRFPFDFSWGVDGLLDRVRPDVVGLVELEVWPNFLAACRRRGVPVVVVNGRLSERSFAGYRRGRAAIEGAFRSLTVAAVQDEGYARRFRAMGTRLVRVTGSMKWDAADLEPVGDAAEALASAMGIDRSRPLIVAGSTGPGEEALLRAACPTGVQLLCAPRKPERFDGAALDLEPCIRRSRPGTSATGGTRFLLDTIGELRAAYALADLVVMGRSFFDLYGSDPIEPVALGRPTLIGPRIGDFEGIVAAFESAGGIARSTRQTLADDLDRLLRDDTARSDLGRRGRACVEANRGASQRHAELLLDVSRVRRRSRRGAGPTAARLSGR